MYLRKAPQVPSRSLTMMQQVSTSAQKNTGLRCLKDRDENPIRPFGCFTTDLHAMVRWLKMCGITTVAMESTGVYWIPPFQILEEHGFEVKLVSARHVKNVPGRKSVSVALSAFIPTGSSPAPSGLTTRYACSGHIGDTGRILSAMSPIISSICKRLSRKMNLRLHKVLSSVTGVTGMNIIRAIIAGERDPRSWPS